MRIYDSGFNFKVWTVYRWSYNYRLRLVALAKVSLIKFPYYIPFCYTVYFLVFCFTNFLRDTIYECIVYVTVAFWIAINSYKHESVHTNCYRRELCTIVKQTQNRSNNVPLTTPKKNSIIDKPSFNNLSTSHATAKITPIVDRGPPLLESDISTLYSTNEQSQRAKLSNYYPHVAVRTNFHFNTDISRLFEYDYL